MKYINRINAQTSSDQLVDILVKEIDEAGFYDTVHLNDILERLKSPLISIDKNGDRKLNASVLRNLKKKIDIEYKNKCWYKVK